MTTAATWAVAVLAIVKALARDALACPNCRIGQEVQARIAQDSFWTNLAITVLPLALSCAVAAALYRIGQRRTRHG